MAKKKATKKKRAAKGKGAKPRAAGDGLELRMVRAGDLESHPENWRVHPGSQVEAFRAVVREVGFVGYVVVNRRTGHVLDGHMRKDAVPADQLVPVLLGDWSEQQERLVLATFNPLGDLAGLDVSKGEALLGRVVSSEPAVQALLEGMEQDIERALAAAERKAGGDKAEDDDGEPEGGGDGGGGGKKDKTVEAVHRVMIECEDKLDQLTLVQRMKAQGYQDVKACGGG